MCWPARASLTPASSSRTAGQSSGPGAGESPSPIRIALPADPHTGIFGNALPVGRIVARINAGDVDAVVLAGDPAYLPGPADIPEDFAALGNPDAPLFAVPGNHDAGRPGSDLTDPLLAALGEAGARIMHNRAAGTDIAGHGVVIAGAPDLWQRRQDFTFSSGLPAGKPVILLTHNPDTALRVPDNFACDLMPAGPAHGGQVRIPGPYQKILSATGPFDRELHPLASPAGERLVCVTTGTGMAGVPLRFLMPPRVDILTINLPATCRNEKAPAVRPGLFDIPYPDAISPLRSGPCWRARRAARHYLPPLRH